MSTRIKLRFGPWTAQPGACIIASSVPGQTGIVASANILPGNLAAGLYRISLQIGIQTAGSAGTLRLSVATTSKSGTIEYSLPALSVLQVNLESGQFVVESNGSAGLFLAVTGAGLTAGSLVYSYRVVVEQIDDQT